MTHWLRQLRRAEAPPAPPAPLREVDPLTATIRLSVYRRQNRSRMLTARQARRIRHKLNRAQRKALA